MSLCPKELAETLCFPGKPLTDVEWLESMQESLERIVKKLGVAMHGVGKWPKATVEIWASDLCRDALELVRYIRLHDGPDIPDGEVECSLTVIRNSDAEAKLRLVRDSIPKIESMIQRTYAKEAARLESGKQPEAIQKTKKPTTQESLQGHRHLLAAAVWCAVLGTVNFHSDWVYQLSRWGVCAVAVYGALGAAGKWRWPLWILAVIYNPIAPIHFDKDHWQVMNWLSSLVLAICATRTPALLTAFKKWMKSNPRDFFISVAFTVATLIILALWLIFPPSRRENGSDDLKRPGKQEWRRAPADRQEEPRKYPRALPGGGLDWSGVEGH